MATTVLNQCSCLFRQSGEIVLITSPMIKLLDRYKSSSNNIYHQLLESTSNCNLNLINEIKTQILVKKRIVDVILKFKRLSTLTLLSFSQVEYLDECQEPVVNCISRELTLPTNCRVPLRFSNLMKYSIANTKAEFDLSVTKLLNKQKAIMALHSLGFVRDKTTTILEYNSSYTQNMLM